MIFQLCALNRILGTDLNGQSRESQIGKRSSYLSCVMLCLLSIQEPIDSISGKPVVNIFNSSVQSKSPPWSVTTAAGFTTHFRFVPPTLAVTGRPSASVTVPLSPSKVPSWPLHPYHHHPVSSVSAGPLNGSYTTACDCGHVRGGTHCVIVSSPALLSLQPDCRHCQWALEVSGMFDVASRTGHIQARRPTGHEARRIKRMEGVL